MEDSRIARKHFSKIGGAYFAGSVLTFLVQLIVRRIAVLIAPEQMSDINVALFVSSAANYLIAMPLLVCMVRRIPTVHLPQHKMGVGKWLVAFLMSYVLMYLANLVGLFLTGAFGVIKGSPVANPLEQVVSGLSPVTALIVMVILAPIVEEYIFRKVLIDRMAAYGEGVAIVLSGLMFGLFHGNLNQFAYAFGLGVFFGFIYVKTGRLRYTVLLHATINFMGSIPGILMLESDFFNQVEHVAGNSEEMLSLLTNYGVQILFFFGYSIFVLLLVIAGIICWALHVKKIKCNSGEFEIPKGQRFRTTILNLGMLCYLAFWLWQIVVQILE